MYVHVAVDRKIEDCYEYLTYLVPKDLEEKIDWGLPVLVPMGKGNHHVRGYIIDTDVEVTDRSITYKPIGSLAEDENLFDRDLVELAKWMSRYYLCPCYYILEYMLPKYARNRKTEVAVWNGDNDMVKAQMLFLSESALKAAEMIQSRKELPVKDAEKEFPGFRKVLEELTGLQMIHMETRVESVDHAKYTDEYESMIEPAQLEDAKKQLKHAVKQFEVLRYLTYEGRCEAKELQRHWKGYRNLVKELEKKHLISKKKVQVERFAQEHDFFYNKTVITLNEDQERAVCQLKEYVNSPKPESALLFGITGSGKTEVYLRTIQHILKQGGGAIMLVPEISLTPQMIGRFHGALGERIEVLHSNLSDGERYDAWRRLKTGETRVVIGVRSAVFAPVQNLRMIILDEEHETTFKQSEPEPRYHAKTVAQKRIEQVNGLLLLGSATPSVESFYDAEVGTKHLITLPSRANARPLPKVDIIDMAREFRDGNHSMFSSSMEYAMEETLKRGEQVILFLNRRGFSRSIVCRECGHTLTCEKCSIALTYHREQNLAKCHYCDYMEPVPKTCPNCGSRFIRYMGSGTEKLEEEVKRRWPWVPVSRMDLDTTKNRDAHARILESFASGETQILIGTQMVAKGLDFPNVTLVGVLAADTILNMPDYTAAERTFQLLTQVAGRAGRGEKEGRVLIQTYNPEHYSIVAAKDHDYRQFYQKEIYARNLMEYPPYHHLVRFLISDTREEGAMEDLVHMSEQIRERYPEVELLGPSEAPISMIRGRKRFHVLFKGTSLNRLREAAEYGKKVMNLSRKSKTLRIIIDVEPSTVL